ncbi:MAG: hypothetical protein K2K56_06905 [Lachnospiraceae bacterium]|nr:hypothetical protein [Lachnospiraceae bacterium]
MRKILMIVFVLFGVLLFPLPAFAQSGTTEDIHNLNKPTTETTPDIPDDLEEHDIAYCTNGRAFFSWIRWTKIDGLNWDLSESRTFDYTITDTINDKGYIYLVEEKNASTGNIKFYICGEGYVSQQYTRNYENIRNGNERYISTSTSDKDFRLYSYFQSSSRTLVFSYTEGDDTNYSDILRDITIPIFLAENTEAITAYENTGDTSGAENADYFNPYDKEDESIPKPHNIKVIQGTDQSVVGDNSDFLTKFHHDIVISWTQDDLLDDMEFEIEGAFSSMRLSDSNYEELKEITGKYNVLVSKTKYGSTKSMTVQISKDILNSYKERGYLTKLVLRVRNSVGKKSSKWVNVTIDLKNKTATATETGYDDTSEIGGDEYNDTTVGGDDVASSPDISLSGILSYIQSGFGLLGSGGIIALMAGTFSFIPGSVWTLIKFAIALNIAVMFYTLIKRFVFS